MKTFLKTHRIPLMVLGMIAALSAVGAIDPASLMFAPLVFGVTTTDLTKSHAGIPAHRIGKVVPIRERITIPVALHVASDIVKLLNVKAGWLVKQVHIIMVTPSTGTTLTANIGDGDDRDGFDAAMSLKGTAGTRTYGIDGTDAYLTSGGKYYAADDTIDAEFATVTAAAGDVVLDVIGEVWDFNT